MTKLEIGIPYSKGRHLYIAVERRLLVSCKDGIAVETKPHSKYTTARSLSVEDLCVRWNIKLKTFDLLMSKYLIPDPPEIKERPRGCRQTKGAAEYYWRTLRTSESFYSK